MSIIGIQLTAVISGSFLAGAMMALSLVLIPVFYDTNTDPAHMVIQWHRMYHYGHFMMPGMAVGTLLLYISIVVLRRRARKPWSSLAIAGVLTISIVPFTWVFMESTNCELFRLVDAIGLGPLDATIAEANSLVVHWGKLHFIRSLLPLAGVIRGATVLISDLEG
ncbi:putative Alpha subunit of GDP-forming succinate-ligase [Seiridium unicorne]|uniref:Alpha subunit of GDP-forming succinate-ligase n=1 Tax=Seiridium unicorne TaxID=138068 RepID=A0ABR2UU06_9PEZI